MCDSAYRNSRFSSQSPTKNSTAMRLLQTMTTSHDAITQLQAPPTAIDTAH